MNRTYQFLLIIIRSGKYSHSDLFSKLDLFFMLDRITEEQYLELSEMLRETENGEVSEYELEEEAVQP
ncbi:MAG: hypothetical protein IJP16_09980 [Clostridia bacterium]|nr:hypothetical protein [Clostridia bacterium]